MGEEGEYIPIATLSPPEAVPNKPYGFCGR